MPLIVTIQLVPGGDVMQSREIGRLVIVNDGTHPAAPEHGNYKLFRRTETNPGRVVETTGRARNIARTDNPWFFLLDFLENVETDL